jgi:hypothetical protein
VEALGVLSAGIASSLSIREDPVQLITDNIRMSTYMVAASELDSTSFTIPTTSTEAFEDTAVVPALQVSSSEAGTAGISVAMMQLTMNPENYTSKAAAVGINIQGNTDDIQTIITLVNKAPVDYFNNTIDGNHSYYCDWSLFPFNTTYVCPDGGNVSISCSGFAGLVTFNCPTTYQTPPSCQALTGSTFVDSSQCDVLYYTASETTCSCVNLFGDLSSRRSRRLSTSSDTFLSIAADSTLVINSFTRLTKFTNNLNIHLVETNSVIVAVTAVITFMFVIGTSWFVTVDQKESAAEATAVSKKATKFLRTKDFLNQVLPAEYSGKWWLKIFYKKLTVDHSWLCMVLPYNSERDYRTVRWVILMGKVTNYLLIDTLLAYYFFADNGKCESITNKSFCLDPRSIDHLDQLCAWDDLHRSCAFNRNVGNSTLSCLILTTIITILAVPVDQLFVFMVRKVEKLFVWYYVERNGHLQIREKTLNDGVVTDLADLQTLQGTLMRGANLMLMQDAIDNVTVEAEAESLMQLFQAKYLDRDSLHELSGAFDLNQFVGYLYDKRFEIFRRDIHFNARTTRQLAHRLQSCREHAENLSSRLNSLESDNEKNILLIKEFLLASVSSSARRFASQFLYSSKETGSKENPWKAVQLVCAVLLVGYIVLANFYIFQYGLDIGAKSNNNWLRGLFVSILIDMVLLYPFRTWVNRVLLAQFSSRDIKLLHGLLRERTPMLMKRSVGQLKNAHALVQHLNPACRAARLNPSLPASRLLMSLHDYDLPAQILHGQTSLLWTAIQPMLLPVFVFFAMLAQIMPGFLTESLLELFATTCVNTVLVGLTVLGMVNWKALVAVVGSLIVLFLLRERNSARRRHKVKSRAVLPVDDVVEMELIESMDSLDTTGGDKDAIMMIKGPASDSNDTLDRPVDAGVRDKFAYRKKWFHARNNGYVVVGKPDWLTGMELIELERKTAEASQQAAVTATKIEDTDAATHTESATKKDHRPWQSAFVPSSDAVNRMYTLDAGAHDADIDETDFEFVGVPPQDNELNLLESWVADMQSGGSYLYNLDETLEHPMAPPTQTKFRTPHRRNQHSRSPAESTGDLGATLKLNMNFESPMESTLEKGLGGASITHRSNSPLSYTSELASKYFKLRNTEKERDGELDSSGHGPPSRGITVREMRRNRSNRGNRGNNLASSGATDSPHASSVESMSLGESEHAEEGATTAARRPTRIIHDNQHHEIGSIFADIEENVEL